MSKPDRGANSEEPSSSASALVATGIGLSRLSGLLRETVFAAFLPLGAANDAFGAATRIPNVLQMLLGEGTLSASFIPVYSSELERDPKEARRVAASIVALLAVVVWGLILIAVLAARPIATVLVPGFRGDERFDLTVELIRITFPAAGLLVLSAWCLGVLNSHRRFFLSYVAPVLWNIGQIAAVAGGAIFFSLGNDSNELRADSSIADQIAVLGEVAEVASWGFLVGAGMQLGVLLPSAWRLAGGDLRPNLHLRGVRQVIGRFGNAVVGRGAVQISAMFDLFLASLLATGAAGALVKAQVLYILPVSVFAVSIAAAELPELSKSRTATVRTRTAAGYRRIAFFITFTTVAYVLLGDRIVGALFERGEFTPDDSLVVWLVLAIYSLGLPATALSRLTQNAVWSQGDTVHPARIAIVRVVISMIIAASTMLVFDAISVGDVRGFLPTLRATDDPKELLKFGAIGITLGSAIGAWVEAFLLSKLANIKIPGIDPFSPLKALRGPAVVAAVVALVTRTFTAGLWPPLGGIVSVGTAGLAYLFACRASGIREVNLLLIGPLNRWRT